MTSPFYRRSLPGTLALCGLMLTLSPGARADARATSYVLIVAHNNSLDKGVRPLKFADDDGARYWELYSQSSADVTLLSVMDPDTARLHPKAAKAARIPWVRNLKREVKKIRRRVMRDNDAGKRSHFTFVYIGHGNVAKDGEGYVNLQDVKLRRRDLFQDVVDQIPATNIHLIIDACKSFFLVSRGPGDWKDDRSGSTYRGEVKAFLARRSLDAHPHVGAIISTSGDEDVHEWSAFRGGVFSHQLRSALRGAADINNDGKVEYSEVGAFIAAANRRVTHQRARIRPFVRPPPANRHVALFDTTTARSRLSLELGRRHQGRFSVEDEQGVRVLDLNKARGRPVRLALINGRKYYVRHGNQESVITPTQRRSISFDDLTHAPAPSNSRGSVDMAYRNDLFAVPLSQSFYEGYLATTDLPAVTFDASHDAGPDISRDMGLHLELAYGLSPVAYGLGGVTHSAIIGARKDIWGPLYLSLRVEVGSASPPDAQLSGHSLLNIGVMGGAGASWKLRPWIRIGAEVDVGYQALITTGVIDGTANYYDPAAIKLGGQAHATFHPFRSAPQIGIMLRAGLFVSFYTEISQGSASEEAFFLPEGSLGLSYAF